MPYVPVPKDLTKVKTKVVFNLTKRQLICFSLGGVAGLPTYFLTRGFIGNTAVLFFKAGVLPGVAFLAIAFLISPYGLPRLAAWLTGKISGINYALRDFLAS